MILAAPAKLTVSLRVTGVRADGYHLLDAEMVSLDLADLIEVVDPSSLPDPAVDWIGPGGLPLASGPPEDDLAYRAMILADRPAHLRVTKLIPPGAGLGGGSSDAAAVLRWAGVDDLELAARLGADVPFCLVGGRARVRGIGEVVEPLGFEARAYTLVTPPFGCSTPAVYARWDALGGPTYEGEGPHNDLEPAALDLEPRLAEWRDRLAEATGQVPGLAGSGSTWFVTGEFPEAGRVVHTLAAGQQPPIRELTPR